ncbi:hypothetical protein PMAYCL1PPCAC_19676 [Pristionchus mayeri]|uniref:Uncharacterized protein n=1 Tax=Pristionchus mayeri TaxID=1317129 RepID=A0AAN5CRT4_9BILA|nr:hypothetical protein PMAYCL1PPCAC_19676 [Pristionchus mayeri]
MQLLLLFLLPLFVFSLPSPPAPDHKEEPAKNESYNVVHNFNVKASTAQYASAATNDDVTIQFQLVGFKAGENNQPYTNYTVKIINNSDQLLCQVVFKPDVGFDPNTLKNLNATKEILTTHGLNLTRGAAVENQFGFIAHDLCTPTIISTTLCLDHKPVISPVNSASAFTGTIMLSSILLLIR